MITAPAVAPDAKNTHRLAYSDPTRRSGVVTFSGNVENVGCHCSEPGDIFMTAQWHPACHTERTKRNSVTPSTQPPITAGLISARIIIRSALGRRFINNPCRQGVLTRSKPARHCLSALVLRPVRPRRKRQLTTGWRSRNPFDAESHRQFTRPARSSKTPAT